MFWDSIRNIGKDCVVGNTPPLSPALQSRILFDWGEKELYTKTSKPLVEKIWPGAGSLSVPEWSTARQWRRYRITQSRLKNGSTKRRNTTRWTFSLAMFRDRLKGLIGKYPEAVCINLGFGFDDKFSQVDNGTIRWFDVVLPDQIAVRRKVYEDRDRCTMMDGNALDGAWTKALPESDMYIIVMEGVLEYFSKEQVRTFLNTLCDSFPHGYLLAELHSPFVEKNSKHHDAAKHTNASFGWGTRSGTE